MDQLEHVTSVTVIIKMDFRYHFSSAQKKCAENQLSARKTILKYVFHVIRTIFFVRYIPGLSRFSVVLRAESWFSARLKFYRTSAEK